MCLKIPQIQLHAIKKYTPRRSSQVAKAENKDNRPVNQPRSSWELELQKVNQAEAHSKSYAQTFIHYVFMQIIITYEHCTHTQPDISQAWPVCEYPFFGAKTQIRISSLLASVQDMQNLQLLLTWITCTRNWIRSNGTKSSESKEFQPINWILRRTFKTSFIIF